ncbi:MAG: YrdB family protein [Anaerolineales bacterium]|nr:YrdB family protein [Anaerolineales bacterium]
MGSNPINLALRFLLELTALGSYALWGKQQADGLAGYLLAIGLPILGAIIWGTFAVPDDPSRSGKAPVPVPGWLRLFLELLIFGLATFCLFDLGHTAFAAGFGLIVLVHYLISYDRIGWLLKR